MHAFLGKHARDRQGVRGLSRREHTLTYVTEGKRKHNAVCRDDCFSRHYLFAIGNYTI
jgi:hypothetical protein